MFPNHNIIYQYDGSFEGLLCCIFESFQRKETPVDIVVEENFQMSLTPSRWITTDLEKAKRVAKGIQKKFYKEMPNVFPYEFFNLPSKKGMADAVLCANGIPVSGKSVVFANSSCCRRVA